MESQNCFWYQGTSSAPEPLKWSDLHCTLYSGWRLGFRVLSDALLLLLSSVRRNTSACAPIERLIDWENGLYAPLSSRERHDLMRLSCNMLDFFGYRIFRPIRMRATSFISTPAFSVAPCQRVTGRQANRWKDLQHSAWQEIESVGRQRKRTVHSNDGATSVFKSIKYLYIVWLKISAIPIISAVFCLCFRRSPQQLDFFFSESFTFVHT